MEYLLLPGMIDFTGNIMVSLFVLVTEHHNEINNILVIKGNGTSSSHHYYNR